jgi:glycosyltransferase involved in cell wall biosynthesis
VPEALRVSVVIPTYNRASLVTRAVTSVLRAIEPGDEIIVVDDGSTDDTERVLAPFASRIRYLRIRNSGPGAARNHGIRAATRPLVAFLDSDDEWLAHKLQLQRAIMAADPTLVFAFSKFAVHDDESGREYADGLSDFWLDAPRPWAEILGSGRRFSTIARLPDGCADFHVHVGDMYEPLLERMYVAASTAIVRTALAGDAFRFAEDLRICEDWFCFGGIARRGPAAYLDCVTELNHGHAGPRLTVEQGQHGLLSARITIVERLWGRDETFLATHQRRYRAVLAGLYARRARWLMSHGRMDEARRDLRRAGRSARSLRLLALLPGHLAHGLGAARRTLLRLRGA